MSEIEPYTVVKWIFIVLAAAFVGQFGKSFAQYLMRKARERAAGQKGPDGTPVNAPPEQRALRPETVGEGSGIPAPGRVSTEAVTRIPDEKAEKKAAKAKKKELKLLKKLLK
ncbi:MAG TPA: hypothetical protein PLR20_13265 [Syntrophales bacterium]|nr:hypothetical protein [Syntrophales bacterium]HOX94533.1 hypothetical protein [Syntrophales bacterium]HPI58195.1 hypothetical protein [Syntrophales bacterium]HPN26033.1 hypothetical protein [Syntrophales bacterium]HQM30314.1 hypothetical protein [Syntrophales bacterium]